MTLPARLRATLAILGLALLPTLASGAKPKPLPDHWVGTWSTANVPVDVKDPRHPPKAWVPGAADTTLREIVHTSLAGPQVRVTFSNAFGTDPLTIGEVHIALAASGVTLFGDSAVQSGNRTGDINLASANALTFNGSRSVSIPPGAEATSDPVVLNLPAGADLAISLFLPAQRLTTLTMHPAAFQTNFLAPGNVVRLRSLNPPSTTLVPPATPAPATDKVTTSWFFLKSVDVLTPAATGTVVAFGDSITDGYASTTDTNQRWPDLLAARLQGDKQTENFGVLNEGIGGNRILADGFGPSALARFDRDVLSQSGVSDLILLEGINDIGTAFDTRSPHPPVTAEQLEDGMAQLAARAHAHSIRVFAATLTPYVGSGYSSPTGEQIREALNQWIRTVPNVFDGIIDFDKATQDPANPNTFNPAYDHGDHLHPNDVGFHAMADAIDLKLLVATK